MRQSDPQPSDDDVAEVTRHQLQLLTEADPRCRGLQLPEGVMLRYNLAEALYFYLKTGIVNGKIATRIFASDSPYEREKTAIGAVQTPMFAPQADLEHLEKVKKLLQGWIAFIQEEPDTTQEFQSFEMRDQRADY